MKHSFHEMIFNPNHDGKFPRALSPDELPDSNPEHFSLPWKAEHLGNGHYLIRDADSNIVAPIFVYDNSEQNQLEAKLLKINNEI